MHDILEQRRNIGVVAQIAQREACEGAKAAGSDEADELVPAGLLNVGSQDRIDAGGLADITDSLGAAGDSVVELAEYHAMMLAELADDARDDYGAGYHRNPAHYMGRSEYRLKGFACVDAVLQRNHRRFATEQWPDLFTR